LLRIISIFSGLLPIFFFTLFRSRNRYGGVMVIFFYCIVSFLTDLSYDFLKRRISNFYIYSTFTIVEYTLFALFLYLCFKEKVFKYILLLCSLIFYGIAFYTLFSKRTAGFDSFSASLEAVFIIIYSILFLYEQIKDPAVFYVFYSKNFWIIVAFFIYFSSTLFLFIYAATFTTQEHKIYWGINFIFNILKNIFFSISFAMKKSEKPQYPMESLYPDT